MDSAAWFFPPAARSHAPSGGQWGRKTDDGRGKNKDDKNDNDKNNNKG
jgi:hypothetical protein